MISKPRAGGIALGALLFCGSLTPSMIPRTPLVQGVLGGLLFALGYLLWYCLRLLRDWLELPHLSERARVVTSRLALALAAISCIACLWLSAGWQNSIRAAWQLPEVGSEAPITVAAITAALFAVLLLLGRAFRLLALRWSTRSTRLLPPKLAGFAGVVIAVVVTWTLVNGVLLRGLLRSVDSASQLTDAVIPPDIDPPSDAFKSGSSSSLIAWENLGRWGRGYVVSGPTAADISAFWGEPALEPLRVYVGLNAALTPEERASLAFDELVRVGGFEREVLVIATPTGSGWLDPGAMNSLEYITKGNVATVSVQYSYLASPVSVVVDPTHGIAESQALFDEVYRHWTSLPPAERPRLYLHGLSLGAFLSQETVPLLDVLGDPINGAMWAGSPFLSDFWNMVVARRQPGSPAWRPEFGNGSLIRAGNQNADFAEASAPWGPIRLVFLQYASDPIVFFDWSLAWRRPDWLSAQRAPDLSPQMRWIPLVTMLQVGVDMAVAVGNLGFGHDYIARDYIRAWAATLNPAGWNDATRARLSDHLKDLVPR